MKEGVDEEEKDQLLDFVVDVVAEGCSRRWIVDQSALEPGWRRMYL